MDKTILTRTRHSTRLTKRDNLHDIDYKQQNIDQTFSDTYSGIGMEESNNYYAMGGTKNNKPNVYSGARPNPKRNPKGSRRVHQANTYNEDEQFKQYIVIWL